MGRIIISFSEDMFDIYLMGNGLFFRNWKKNSVKFITNQMQMNKMNFHLPVQQWQRRFAGVRYISICYWLSWHSMWLMQVLHYKPQWSVPIGTWIWKTIVVLGETFLTPFCLYTSFFFFFNLAAVHCRFLTDKFPEGEVGREGAWFCFLNVCNIVGSITYNLWIQVVPFTKRRLTPFLTCWDLHNLELDGL